MPKRSERKARSTTWSEALDQFVFLKQAQGASPRTMADYRFQVEAFFRQHRLSWSSPSLSTDVFDYMSQPVAPATYNLRLQNLKAFFGWCANEGYLAKNPLSGFKKRRSEARAVNIDKLTIRQLVSLADRGTYAGLRDYTLFLLTLDTGIRPSEALSLRCDDIDSRSMEVKVRAETAKTRVSRTLPISPITCKAIAELVDARHPNWGDSVPLLCSASGTRLTRYSWAGRLREYSRRLGVRIRPYDLRHFFALEYLRNGGNVFSLQRTLGHTDLAMTKRYVSLTAYDLRTAHTAASPLKGILPTASRLRKIRPE